ncbi:MAG: hypothetical protein ACK4NC_06260 [Candidatus Gracilibacteria bacterium]
MFKFLKNLFRTFHTDKSVEEGQKKVIEQHVLPPPVFIHQPNINTININIVNGDNNKVGNDSNNTEVIRYVPQSDLLLREVVNYALNKDMYGLRVWSVLDDQDVVGYFFVGNDERMRMYVDSEKVSLRPGVRASGKKRLIDENFYCTLNIITTHTWESCLEADNIIQINNAPSKRSLVLSELAEEVIISSKRKLVGK